MCHHGVDRENVTSLYSSGYGGIFNFDKYSKYIYLVLI
jgi:hypothetical protein